MPKSWLSFWALGMLIAGCLSAQAPAQSFPLRDATGLIASKAKLAAVDYQGRKCVRVAVADEDGDGLALLPGIDFEDGTIEADIALKAYVPPGGRNPGFVGIAFRVKPDQKHYELFYLRPGNADSPDQAMRNHAVQYVSEPEFDWYPLRRTWPWVYESHADLAMETWMKVRIEVAGRAAKLFLNGSEKPALVVDGLKGEDLHGAVGLWSYAGEEAYFSNVRVTPAAPQILKNGSDVAGSWQIRYSSDAGRLDATMDLHRDGNRVTGTWSSPLGEGKAVTGTWREGYIELSMAGDWPKEAGVGAPGLVTALLSGWIDGDSGKGRMRVEGRSDGVWAATRKEQAAAHSSK